MILQFIHSRNLSCCNSIYTYYLNDYNTNILQKRHKSKNDILEVNTFKQINE